jgi:hypothetical protein
MHKRRRLLPLFVPRWTRRRSLFDRCLAQHPRSGYDIKDTAAIPGHRALTRHDGASGTTRSSGVGSALTRMLLVLRWVVFLGAAAWVATFPVTI